MVRNLEDVDRRNGALIRKRCEDLRLGVAGKKAAHFVVAVRVGIYAYKQYEAVGIAPFVAVGCGRNNRCFEPTPAHAIPFRNALDRLTLQLSHELDAALGRASRQVLRHDDRSHRYRAQKRRQGAAVVVVSMGDHHGIESVHVMAGKAFEQVGIIGPCVDKDRPRARTKDEGIRCVAYDNRARERKASRKTGCEGGRRP